MNTKRYKVFFYLPICFRADVKTEEGYKKSYKGYVPFLVKHFICGINQKIGLEMNTSDIVS